MNPGILSLSLKAAILSSFGLFIGNSSFGQEAMGPKDVQRLIRDGGAREAHQSLEAFFGTSGSWNLESLKKGARVHGARPMLDAFEKIVKNYKSAYAKRDIELVVEETNRPYTYLHYGLAIDTSLNGIATPKSLNRDTNLRLVLTQDMKTNKEMKVDANSTHSAMVSNPVYLPEKDNKEFKSTVNELATALGIPMSEPEEYGQNNIEFQLQSERRFLSRTLQHYSSKVWLDEEGILHIRIFNPRTGEEKYSQEELSNGHIKLAEKAIALVDSQQIYVVNADGSWEILENASKLTDDQLKTAREIHLSPWALDDFEKRVNGVKSKGTADTMKKRVKDIYEAAGESVATGEISLPGADSFDLILRSICEEA